MGAITETDRRGENPLCGRFVLSRLLRPSSGIIEVSNPSKGGVMAIKTRPCEVCRALIEPERVEAIPETRLCSEHAKMIAKYGGEFTLSSTQESLGKVGSLKKNYGGITPEKTRNAKALEQLRRELAGAGEAGGGVQ